MNNIVELFTPEGMLETASKVGTHKARRSIRRMLLSAILSGFFIGIAFVFYVTVTTGAASLPFGISKLIGGICFSLGLMLVVFCGTDLFTSAMLLIVSRLQKQITTRQLIVNWVVVYIGNFIGGLVLVLFMWLSQEYSVGTDGWGSDVLATASLKLSHTFWAALFLGIMCNIMVCLAVWLSYSGRTLIDKMMVMILPVALFVASGFEHSIANMFMIPMGILIRYDAPASFWSGINSNPDAFSHLTISNFFISNLIPVTIGNIIGGLIVALCFYALHHPQRNS